MLACSVEELKNQLRLATSPTKGSFGEKIYALHMLSQGRSVESWHEESTDFKVEGLGRVDVKTRGLGKTGARTSNRISGTVYSFVELYEDRIDVTHEDAERCIVLPTVRVDWEQALCFWNELDYQLRPVDTTLGSLIEQKKTALERWILEHWQLKAAVRHRHGRDTQRNMTGGKRAWGPTSFYESPTARVKHDLRVMLHFDHENIYQILAYPVRLRDEIIWLKSPMNNKSITFNPAALCAKFVFKDEADFQSEYPRRFFDR